MNRFRRNACVTAASLACSLVWGADTAAPAAALPAAVPSATITAAMVRQVGAPAKPDNGALVVHPGMPPKDCTKDTPDPKGKKALDPNPGKSPKLTCSH